MPRGRPTGSQIRQNIIDLLGTIQKPLYGYQLHKIYIQLFVPCTREVIYYHLKKGVQLEEIKLQSIRQEKGEFSWGVIVEKRYYGLGSRAKAHALPEEVQKKIEALKL